MKLLLLTLLLPLASTQYEIEKLENPLLPVKLGLSYIVDNYHHIYYHINLTNIRKSLKTTKITLFNVTAKLTNRTTPLYDLLLIRTQNLLEQVKIIEEFINHYSSKRPKRGLLNVIGKVHKYLYGTLDADDGERYEKYMKLLQENQNTLQNDISSTQTILKQVTRTIDNQLININTNQKKLQAKLNEVTKLTQSTIELILLIDNIGNNIRILNELRTNIQTAINFAEINIMHYSILKYQELQKIISKLPPDQKIPFDNIIKFYEVAHADVTIKNNLIIFYIAIPLITNKPYTLYRLYPIPLDNKITILKNPYLLASPNEYFNVHHMCNRIEEIILCTKDRLNKNEPCVGKTINLTDHCPLTPILYNKTSITQLSDNSLIVVPSAKEKIIFQCPEQTIEIITNPSLIIPKQCTVKIQKKQFDSQDIDTINLRLKLPSIIINTSLIQNIEPLQLKEINLDSIHDDLSQIETLNIHPLKSFDVNTGISIFNIILTVIIIIIVIFIGYCYCYRRIKKQAKVSIELKTLEKATPFSHS